MDGVPVIVSSQATEWERAVAVAASAAAAAIPAAAPPEAPGAPLADAFCSAPPDPDRLPCAITLCNLKARSDLNGCRGTAYEWDVANEYFLVSSLPSPSSALSLAQPLARR